MITKENIKLLETYLSSPLSKEEILIKAKELLALQDARQQAVQRIANEHFVIQQDILAGNYDDSLETIKIEIC